jgi:DUF4097 and DUF4098 domain-containing protein YvlB
MGKGDVCAVEGASPLTIKTGKGDVVVRAWHGDLDVTTGKGDVAVSDLTGGLHMTTGAGETVVEHWQAGGANTHQIKTGSGEVVLNDAQAQSLEVTTGRGAARCGRWRCVPCAAGPATATLPSRAIRWEGSGRCARARALWR